MVFVVDIGTRTEIAHRSDRVVDDDRHRQADRAE